MFATNWFSSLKSGRRSGRANAKLAYGEVLETRQLLSAEPAATPTVAMESDQGSKPAESQSPVGQNQVDSELVRWIRTTTNSSSHSTIGFIGPQSQDEFGFSQFGQLGEMSGQLTSRDVEAKLVFLNFNATSDATPFFGGAGDELLSGTGNDLLSGSGGINFLGGNVGDSPTSKLLPVINRDDPSETPVSEVAELLSDDSLIQIERWDANAVEFSQNQASPSLTLEAASTKWIDQIFQDSTRGTNDFFSNLERENTPHKSAVTPESLERIRPTESLTAEFGSRTDPNRSVSQNTADRVRSREDHFFTFEKGKLVEVTDPELRQELLGAKVDAELNSSELIGTGFGFTPSEWSPLRSRDAQMLDRTPSQSGRRRTAMNFIQWRD